MYSMLHGSGRAKVLAREVPALIAALVTAEVFYKFHSFTLECVAFLATWTLFGWLGSRLFPG
jgi:hypothetical protein